MSGGAGEYQMGLYKNVINEKYSGMCDYYFYNSGYKGIYGNSSGNVNCNPSITNNTNGLDYPSDKYYKSYINTSVYSNNLGEALGESRWYKDLTQASSVSYPWFVRGGYYSLGLYSGGFSAGDWNGNAGGGYSSNSFRTIVTTS